MTGPRPLVLEPPPTAPTHCEAPGCRRRLPARSEARGRWRRFCDATCRSLAKRKRDARSRSASVEWYTPSWVLGLALSLAEPPDRPPLERFDLDPCAAAGTPAAAVCRELVIGAEGGDGLVVPWHGAVWCNPPYGAAAFTAWTRKAAAEVGEGRARVVVLLVPLRPSSRWWRDLLARPDLEVKVHPVERRISFHERQADGSISLDRGRNARFECALIVVRGGTCR